MTVNEAIRALQALAAEGYGDTECITVNDSLMDVEVESIALSSWRSEAGVQAVVIG